MGILPLGLKMLKARRKVTTSEEKWLEYVILGKKNNTNKPTISLPAWNLDDDILVVHGQ